MNWTTSKRLTPVHRKSPEKVWPLKFVSKADNDQDPPPEQIAAAIEKERE